MTDGSDTGAGRNANAFWRAQIHRALGRLPDHEFLEATYEEVNTLLDYLPWDFPPEAGTDDRPMTGPGARMFTRAGVEEVLALAFGILRTERAAPAQLIAEVEAEVRITFRLLACARPAKHG